MSGRSVPAAISVAVAACAVFVGACTSPRASPVGSAPSPGHSGVTPEAIGRTGQRCPDDHPIATRDGLAYPAGHPVTLSNLAPGLDRCFRTADEAIAAGFPIADPPRGAVVVGDVYLVPVDSELERTCRRAARAIGMAVACPSLLPAQGSLLLSIEEGSAVFEGGFPLPPSHDPGSTSHLWVISTGPNLASDVGRVCGHELRRLPIAVRDSPAAFIECGEGSERHGGHVVLVWHEGRGSYAVSLHGVSMINRELDRAIAESARLIGR